MRYLAALAPLAVFAIDRLPTRGLPLAVLAALDEPAHLATAAVFLAALRPPLARSFAWGALLGVVMIDLDHLPALLGSRVLTAGTPRPYSHSLLAIAVVLVVAALLPARWRRAALGVAFGMAAHLIRDLATPVGAAPGVSLLWPVSPRAMRFDYGYYAALLALAAGLAIWRARTGRRARTGGALP